VTPEEIGKALDLISQKLGPAAQHIYELSVRQVYIDGVIGGIVTGLILLFTTVSFAIFAYKMYGAYRKAKSTEANPHGYSWERVDPFNYAFPVFMTGMISTFVWVCLGLVFFDSLTHLLNPEYWAIQNILRSLPH